MFSPFSSLFFTFADQKLPLQPLGFVLIEGVSGYLWFLGTSCTPKVPAVLLEDAAGSQLTAPRLASIFSIGISADIFYAVFFPSDQVNFCLSYQDLEFSLA